MADKKISELQDASFIDYDNDYTIALRGTKNFKVKIGDIINESKLLIPKKLSQLEDDMYYITDEELESKEYLTESKAEDIYFKRVDEKTKLEQFDDYINFVTKKDLSDKEKDLKYHTELSVETLKSFVDTYIQETRDEFIIINNTIIENKQEINNMLDADFLKIADLPVNVSYYNNDSGYITLVDLAAEEAKDDDVNNMLSRILK